MLKAYEEGAQIGGNSLNSLHAEGNALKWGMECVWNWGLREIWAKTDSLRLVNIVNEKECCPIDFEPIRDDIQELYGRFSSCNLSFVKREQNGGKAHCLAKSVTSLCSDQ